MKISSKECAAYDERRRRGETIQFESPVAVDLPRLIRSCGGSSEFISDATQYYYASHSNNCATRTRGNRLSVSSKRRVTFFCFFFP